MELIELHSDSFRKLKGTKGYVLGIPNANNLTLVMFYSTQCEYCDQAIPELARLSRHLRENNLPIQVAICDVGKNRVVIKEASETVDPIKYVPYTVIYLKDRPYVRYNGNKVAEEMFKYLIEVMRRIDTRQQFVKADSRGGATEEEEKEPEQSSGLGIPYNTVTEQSVCYLTNEEATGMAPRKLKCVGNVCYLTHEEMYGGGSR
jgi:thiol-disulfide isomerase/thioredoxin